MSFGFSIFTKISGAILEPLALFGFKFKKMLVIKRLKLLLFLIFLVAVHLAHGQDKDYARRIIDTLASPALHGRGYVNEGDKKAANFIASEFEQFRLKSYSGSYFQSFEFPINTFPGAMKVKVNAEELIPGEDFLVWPSSPGFKIKTGAIYLDEQELMDARKIIYRAQQHKKVALVADLSGFSDANEKKQVIENLQSVAMTLENHPIIWLTNEKLTWSLARHATQVPIIQIKKPALREVIQKIDIEIENKYFQKYQSQNVIGYLEGTNRDSLIVLTAHYDHLGRMGRNTYFPGANDNASGVALMLNLARHFTGRGEKPAYDMAFIAFGAEEAGLIGSRYFVENPLFAKD